MLFLAACGSETTATGGVSGDGSGTLDSRSSLSSTTSSSLADGGAAARARLQEQIAAVGDRVWFEYDRSELNPVARKQIERWAEFVRLNPQFSFVIQGHCDEHGTREYNLALGERRAAAAKFYLVSLGVDARRVSTVSYGKEQPAVVGSNEQAWAQNRRAVLVVSD
jgi:peptidoglycan-associated lipoprotein